MSALIAILAVLLVLPVGAVVYGSFRSGSPSAADGTWTLENYREFWPSVWASGALVNSVVLAVCCTPISLIVGGALAFVRDRTDLPVRTLITPLVALGLVIIPTIRAMGWSIAADPHSGLINTIARTMTGNSELVLVDITSWGGVILLVSLAGAQLCYFRFTGSFSRVGAELAEASRVSGAGRARTLLRVTMPLVWPIVGFIAVVSFVIDLQVFTEPYIIGAEPVFLMTAVVDAIVNSSPPDYGAAGVLGVVTIGLALALGAIHARGVGERDVTTLRGRGAPGGVIEVRRWRIPLTLAIALFFCLTVVIPIVSTVLASVTIVPGDLTQFGVAAYQRAFGFTTLTGAAQNSAFIAVVGGLAAVLIALAVAVARLRAGARGLGAVIGVIFLIALGMPGVVQALGMTWAYTTLPGLSSLYGTNALAFIALVAVAIPVLSQILHGSLRQISIEFEHAAVVAGANRVTAFLRFTVPLLLPSLLSGWFIAALLMFGNLEIPLLLGAPGNPLFMQLVSTMFSSGDRAAAAALTVLFLAVLATCAVAWLLSRSAFRRFGAIRRSARALPLTSRMENSLS
ncbi:ABC transporter permease [Microbacterium allomyrinae]|uniref:Iron ABC transporter permease n=1 Tax=Microbacterium allomyrinae TaxID=2830666 RepID=A0A9X1S3L1_9MICO|nr:hypothetical protein [Microbacterium allomyrinae]MCC2032622.1 iron ABC transporter permease [Microbacterium allomyrinae]